MHDIQISLIVILIKFLFLAQTRTCTDYKKAAKLATSLGICSCPSTLLQQKNILSYNCVKNIKTTRSGWAIE